MSATSHPVAASGWFAEALERAEANEDGASRTLALAGLVECAAVRHRETEFVQWSSQLASTGAESTVGTQVAALLARAAVADADGDQTLACEARVASLVGLRWLHDRAGTHEQLDQLALYAAAAGDWAQAAFLVTATAKDRQGTGLVVPLRHAAAVGRLQRRVERSSDPVVLAARRAGRASTLGRAAAVAATAHRAGHPVLLATEGWP